MEIIGLEKLGISLNDDQKEKFSTLKKELLEWNKKINLTSIESEEDIATKHFLDSLTLSKAIDLTKTSTLLDIGSGAGFPGIPLKIVFPNIKITLVDSVKKKVDFTKHIIKTLNLDNVEAISSRSEDLPKDFLESFDIVTSRAVAELKVLSELCLPYVKLNGLFIAYKSKDLENELVSAQDAISVLGGKVKENINLSLSDTINMERNLFGN